MDPRGIFCVSYDTCVPNFIYVLNSYMVLNFKGTNKISQFTRDLTRATFQEFSIMFRFSNMQFIFIFNITEQIPYLPLDKQLGFLKMYLLMYF